MADGYVDRLIYALDGDVGPFKAKAAQVDAEAARMGAAVKTATQDMFKPATDSAKALEQEISNLQRKISSGLFSQNDIQRLAGARNQLSTLGNDAKKTTEAIRLQGYQINSLTQQATDFMVQVGSGGGFFRPLLQQAPQAVDAVGGVGNALRLLGGAAGIARVALAGLPVVVGVVMATAFIKGQNEAAQLEKSLALIGGAAGVTRGQIELLSKSIDGVGRGRAREILSGLAGSGVVPSGQLSNATELANDFSRATGVSTGEAATYLAKILKDPAKGAQELNEKFNALTYAQERQVQQLIATGDRQGAVNLILTEAKTNFANAAEQAGYLEKMLHGAGDAAGGFWSWLKGLGRPETPEERLANGTSTSGYQDPITGMYGASPAERRAQNRAIARRRTAARVAEQREIDEDRVKAGMSVADAWDVSGAEARRRRENLAALNAGLDGAEASGDTAAEARFRAAIANANNPNYKPGTGVPKGRTGVSRLSIMGDTAAQELANAQQVADAPMRDREFLHARLAAELEYQRAIKQTGASEADAAKVRAAKIAEAKLAIQSRTKDVLQGLADETDAQNKVVRAYDISTAAVQQQTIAGQAHLAWLKGEITDEKAYAEALSRRAFAQTAATAAQQLAQQRTSNSGLGRLVAANGDPRALAAAQRENEALASTQAARDAARTKEEIDLANKQLDQMRRALQLRDELGRQAAANDNFSRLQEQLELSQRDYELQFASASLRAREMADLQTIIDLKREGWSVDDAGYQKELERRQKANRDLAELGVRRQLRDAAQGGIREGIDAALNGNFGELLRRKLYDAALDGLSKGITAALSAVAGSGGKGGGGFWSATASAILSVFGGGKALGGDLDPSRYYMVGEQGPEILGPGVAGSITPMKAPNTAAMQPQAVNQNVHFTYDIKVSGNGDNELMGRMKQVAEGTVRSGLSQYDQSLNRTLPARIQQANKRVLR